MDISFDIAYPVAAEEKEGSALLWRQEDDKFILLARHDMYVMNEFAKEVFALCDGTRSIRDIAVFCSQKYNVTMEEACTELERLIDFAIDRKLMFLK